MTKEETALNALNWFRAHNISAFVEDDSVYVEIDGFEFQLSYGEVLYRAEEYVRLKENNLLPSSNNYLGIEDYILNITKDLL
jgi:hypothetical protein